MIWVIAFQFCAQVAADQPIKCQWSPSPHPMFKTFEACENMRIMIRPKGSMDSRCELKGDEA